MENLTLLTYTNSKASDLHNIYFDRIEKFFDIKNHLVLTDKSIDNKNIQLSLYKEDDGYWKHILNALKNVKTDYIIYAQEDYILFDFVDIGKINNFIEVLDNDSNISFIRLIYSGVDYYPEQYNKDLIYLKSEHEYYFSTQVTIWRKQNLIDLFSNSKTNTIWEESSNSKYLKELNKIGLCVKEKGKKIGGHYNSLVYPYIATAIVKGKWNYSQYKNELDDIFINYNVNKEQRELR